MITEDFLCESDRSWYEWRHENELSECRIISTLLHDKVWKS